jgi:hypothetical protein
MLDIRRSGRYPDRPFAITLPPTMMSDFLTTHVV